MSTRRRESSVFHPFGPPRGTRGGEAQPHTHVCAEPGCTKPGEYKAPRDRRLNEYIWLCLDHVRAYNKRWNYYEGMSADEVEDEIRRDTCWQRPSWKLGDRVAANWSQHLKDDFDLFRAEREQADRQRREWTDGARQRRRAGIETPEEKALRALDLAPPLTREELRARYLALVKVYHPDVNQGDKAAEERLKDINEAYKTLLSGLDP